MRQILFTLLLVVSSSGIFAGQGTGKVSTISMANDAPVVFFKLDGDLKDSPKCNETKRFAVDLSRLGGPATYKAVLAAKNYGHELVVKGLNTCRGHWKSEDVKNITLR